MKKWLLRILAVIVILILAVIIFVYSNIRDRHPGYNVDINIPSPSSVSVFKAGFAALPITPEIVDTWNDVNNDARYKEKDGDTYNDNNDNGKFDAFWIAGFHSNRPANGVHDDVWARVAVFDDGNSRIALVSLDAIGFMHDDVVDVRERIPENTDLDYVLIASTHTHESYDLMGIWGQPPLKSGVDPEMMDYVKTQTVQAIETAVINLRPAKLAFAQDLTGAAHLVKDTREPIVKDDGLRLIQAIDTKADSTLGVVVGWANHPETLWSKNLMISSDFPHYLREGIEKGLFKGDSLYMDGVGGTALFFNGAIGGLMCPHSSLPVKDPFKDTSYIEPSFDKTHAVGYQVASLALDAIANPDTVVESAAMALKAKTMHLPLDNKVFTLAASIGILNKGMVKWNKIRSEVAVFTIGPASFISLPGEIYPEIVNGGITDADGRDYLVEPVEIPPLRELMPGKYKFVIGLANDEIGYIIPKSEWDAAPPFMFDPTGPYGEENSLGPETAPIIYKEMYNLLGKDGF
ncbi:MAG: hypothetical protein ABFS16_12465 [Bacteroidota bacterium]